MQSESKFKVPFAVTAGGMLGGLGYLIWKWSVPVTSLFGGHVFTAQFTYVGAGAVDSFQCGVAKMFVASMILSAAILPGIALGGAFTRLQTTIQKRTFLFLSLVLCVFPLSALGIAVVALTRYIFDMGLTPARVKGVICGVSGILFIAAFLFFLAKSVHKTPRKSSP